jgi:hypothetical protein
VSDVWLTSKRSFPFHFALSRSTTRANLSISTVSTEDGDPSKEGIKLEDLKESVKGTISRLGRQPNLLRAFLPLSSFRVTF